jgi:hypothetical protein
MTRSIWETMESHRRQMVFLGHVRDVLFWIMLLLVPITLYNLVHELAQKQQRIEQLEQLEKCCKGK